MEQILSFLENPEHWCIFVVVYLLYLNNKQYNEISELIAKTLAAKTQEDNAQ